MQDRVIEIGHHTPPAGVLALGRGAAPEIVPASGAHAGPRTLRVWRSNRASAALPDLERALVNPAAVFDAPDAVRDHPWLLRGCKREILRRWAWDEYLKEVAAAEGMAEGEPSQLDAVRAALLALGESWRPDPAAPAAARPVIPDAEPQRAAA